MNTDRPAAQVRFDDLFMAFEFVSASAPYDTAAYVDRETGKTILVSPELESEAEIPDDIDTSERYLAIPSKRDLDLGRDLVFSFMRKELPAHFDEVVGIFQRKGAYARFKNFLDRRNALERWHDYEEQATEEALRQWCEENGLSIGDDRPRG